MLLAHKVEIYATKQQSQYLLQCCGASRFVYNQLVDMFNNSDKTPSKKDFTNKVKDLRSKYSWLAELSTRIARNNVDDIANTIKKAFSKEMVAKRAKTKNYKLGFPKFHKRGVNDSFSIREKEKIKVDGKKFKFEKFPKSLGRLKLRQRIRFNGVVKQMTISRKANKWFVSFLIDTDDVTVREPSRDVVGVDLGIKELATLSNGTLFTNVRSLKTKEKHLRNLQKRLSRQVKESNNYNKTKLKIQRLFYYVTEARKASLHNLTSYLIKTFGVIGIEELNVSGMLKNHNLAKAIQDVGFYEFRRQIEYKAKVYGRKVILVDRFYPSSKTCSNCGNIKKDLKLSDRTYKCEKCNIQIDRDLNASINLKQVATCSRDTINDCGESIIRYSVKQ